MERINRILRAACMALTAALMAGCAVYAVLRAMGFGISWLPVYIAAVAVSALMQLSRKSTVSALIVTLAAIAGGVVLLSVNAGAVVHALKTAEGIAPDLSGAAKQALGFGCGLAMICSALFSLMLKSPAAIGLALVAALCGKDAALTLRRAVLAD